MGESFVLLAYKKNIQYIWVPDAGPDHNESLRLSVYLRLVDMIININEIDEADRR